MTDLVYHYTSLETALNILRGKSLWLSSISHQNDSEELKGGIKRYIYHSLREMGMKEERIDAQIDSFLQQIVKNKRIFCTSFSKECDLLSQWRGYAEMGEGCAIGFDKKLLKSFCDCFSFSEDSEFINLRAPGDDFNNVIHAEINDCSYVDNISNRVLDSGLSKDTVTKFSKAVKAADEIEVSKALGGILNHSAFLKDINYKEEKEVRLVVRLFDETDEEVPQEISFNSNLNVRAVGNKLIPYYVLPLPNKCIKSITLGPQSSGTLNKDALRTFLRTQDMSDEVEIMTSEITYRK